MDVGFSKPNILIVDDQPENIKILASFLKREYTLLAATSGVKALALAADKNRPHLILLDIMMPEMNGFEVCRRLKSHIGTRDIPVIFITAKNEIQDETRGFQVGAVDYITKPFNPEIVESRVKTHLELKRHREHLEDLVEERTLDLKQSNRQLQTTLEKLEEEITVRKKTENKLQAGERKLTSIIDAFRGFIYTCEKDQYHVDFMNQALIDHMGVDGAGRTCFKAIFGLDAPCPWCVLERVCNGETVEFEFEHPKTGQWFHAIHAPVPDSNGSVAKRQVIFIDITRRIAAERALQEREAYLRKENLRLKASMKDRYRFGNIVGKSKPMQAVYETILRAASTDANVIIYGESGTGKELVARAIHDQSERRTNPLVPVNCGAIPEGLAESEFFGHKKGAFTGAESDKTGYLDIAAGGSLFLDEIGAIPLDLQVKLLRAIEQGGFCPVGSREVKRPDFRVIAATSSDLKDLVKKGKMRNDFFYRIHIIPISLPPLRERKEDIPHLVEHFLEKYDPEKRPAINGKILDALRRYDWPGNVRELQNTLHRYVTLNKIDFMGAELARSHSRQAISDIGLDEENPTLRAVLESVEKRLIMDALRLTRWRKGKAAQMLGVDPKTLFRKIKQHQLK
ncbi:MAG TPA: sigma 54-interacting transcriptional regulator [Desulfobacteria bacterium]|nr:sigma 54-interacting transcriptional regulator [Desulfobacteria bacterium]